MQSPDYNLPLASDQSASGSQADLHNLALQILHQYPNLTYLQAHLMACSMFDQVS